MVLLTDRYALRPLELFELDHGLRLAVCPENGRWMAMDNAALDIASSLDGQLSVQEVIDRRVGSYRSEQVMDLLAVLQEQSFLTQEGDRAVAVAPSCRACSPGLGVLNLTQRCNLACTYCYASAGQDGASDMAPATALAIVDELLELNRAHGKRTTILFHGGEPFLNFAVMAEVVAHYAACNAPDLAFRVQTNATLLTPEHAEWIRDNHIAVGVSIDGQQRTNDIHRRTRDGAGSFERIVKGIRLLRAFGVRVGAIVVLTRDNYGDVDALFAALQALGIRSVSVNPVFFSGRGAEHAPQLELTGEQIFAAYRAMACNILAHNASCAGNAERIEERQLKYLTRNILIGEPSYMCLRTPCGAGADTVAFDVNGDVYGCDVLLPQAEHRLGNIHERSLASILDHEQVQRLASRSLTDQRDCATCTWRVLCQGICPAHTHYAANASEPHAECEFRRLMIPYLIRLFIEQEGAQFLLDNGLECADTP